MGNEQTVFDCPARSLGDHNCGHSEDAGVGCTGDRPVKIICPSNQTIDSDSNQNFATVNLPGPAASYHSSLGWFEITIDVDGSTRRVNDEVRLSIADSPHVLQFNASDANNTATCSTQISVVGIGVRLVGGSDSMEGRVEVFWNGAWGTVCDDDWDLQDATVICRELGFGEAYAAPHQAAFGRGTGDILLDNVECTGNEETVFDCTAIRGSGHNCGHSKDAGVQCTGDRPVKIICPSNQTIDSDSNQNFATVNLPGPAASYHSSLGWLEITIDVDGSTRRVNDEVRLSIADSPHVLQFNASDANNTATCSTQISVVVNQPPVITCPPNQTIQTYPNQNFATVTLPEPASASDNSGWFEITIDADGSTRRVNDRISLSLTQSRHTLQYTARDASNNFATCTMQITVIGQCPTNTTTDGLRWPVAVAGSTAKSVQRCPLTSANAGQPVAVRNCSKLEAPLYFRWEKQQTRGCGDKKEVSLDNVVKVEVSKGNAVEVAEFLANQTSESSKEAEDVTMVASILENIAKAGSGDKEVTELVLETVSNVIMSVGPETHDSEPTQIEAGTSSAIVKSVETQISLTLQQEGKVSIRQDSIHVEAVSLEPNQTRNGLSFVSVKQSNVTSPGQGSPQEGTLAGTEVETLYSSMIPKDLDVLASARLPGNITNLLPSPDAQLQASFLIYADDTLFQSASIKEHRGEGNSTRKVAGSVVSLTVENVELVNLTEPVVIEFKEESSEVHCVSWDFELEDGVGDWTTDGCALAEVTNKTVVCNCSHATNFAILVDVKGQAPDDKDDTPAKRALDIISQVGAALSIIALAITLIIYLAIRKLRSGKSRQIFINFCFSLFMLYIVFVAGVDNAKGSGGGCVFVAALLHYLTLSTMMWMAVEARNMYVSTVKVFPEDTPRYMLKACLIAWGSPLIVLIITLAAASHHYANEHYCFVEPGLVLYLGLLVPIGLILIHNIITFILVMRSLLKVKEASRSQQISKRLQNAVGISALMGLTWCFGFLAINEAAFAFQLIFCLANSLQGVVVFIMFCARREEVRTALAPYMKRICCGHECRLPTLHPEKSNESEMVSATAHTLPSAGQTAEVEISVTTPQ
ncbi:adhesion G-protein coupled receptor G6-like isoform X2 [Patiria miniata]|uniref:Uncharacterized protein n=2 Tax=Patiria miniata TaxID=46514 RepID=A0A913ZKE2_PATMI|nr:adhesion G-protein coupled receptor G6-like isoform X2 [Patiria miniata]